MSSPSPSFSPSSSTKPSSSLSTRVPSPSVPSSPASALVQPSSLPSLAPSTLVPLSSVPSLSSSPLLSTFVPSLSEPSSAPQTIVPSSPLSPGVPSSAPSSLNPSSLVSSSAPSSASSMQVPSLLPSLNVPSSALSITGVPSSKPVFSTTNFSSFPTLAPSLVSNSSTESSLSNLAHPAMNASVVVLLTVLLLVFLLCAGIVFFRRWDVSDRKILLYVPPKKSASDPGCKTFSELAAYRKGIDDAFLAGSVPSVVLEDAEDVEFDQRNRSIKGLHRLLRCWLPKSEELSILVAGNMLPRFLHALYRYHPWVWFFSEGSRKSTRVMRFVITFKFLLTSLFVTTVLYDINYPSLK